MYIVSVLLSTSVERVGVSRMRDFFLVNWPVIKYLEKKEHFKIAKYCPDLGCQSLPLAYSFCSRKKKNI